MYVFNLKKPSNSPYINRFLQPDTIIPDLSNPQSWNRYAYGQDNPIRYSDPTGHRTYDGCSELAGGCNITQHTLDEDLRKEEEFRQTTNANKCKQGNKLYCSYAQNHPVETAAFFLGSFVGIGLAATAVANATAVEGISAGISVAADCITTKAKGGQCSVKNALITGAFSIFTGGLRGRVASLFTLDTPQSIAGLIFSNVGITAASNTLQRTAKGNSTTANNFYADEVSGILSSHVQLVPIVVGGDPDVLGPIATAVSSVLSALIGRSTDPNPTIIP